MKRNKKIKQKRGEIYLTVSFRFVTRSIVGMGKTNGLCEKEMIVVILSMKYLFKLTD